MKFVYPITVAHDTTASSPERVQAKLDVGILTKVRVYFPWGCAGLVGVRVFHYEHQLYPTNLDEWFIGNEISIEFDDEYWIVEGPKQFWIEAYNEDDLYNHTPIVEFVILRSGGLYAAPATSLEA